MPLWGIDISHHQPSIDLSRVKREGFEYVIARVGQGAGNRLNGSTYGLVKDRAWNRHKNEARRVGLILVAYWYIGDRLTPEQNAAYCKAWMGDTSIPVALDCEDGSGNIAFYKKTLAAFRRAGLYVPLSYIPRWYWSHPKIGYGNLSDVPPLWSSRYVSGDGYASSLYPGDNSSMWNGYGGGQVKILQFTSKANISNYSDVDANAFKGTRAEFIKLISRPKGGGSTPAPKPVPTKPPVEEETMPTADEIATAVVKKLRLQSSMDISVDKLTQLIERSKVQDRLSLKEAVACITDTILTVRGQWTWKELDITAWEDLESKQWGRLFN